MAALTFDRSQPNPNTPIRPVLPSITDKPTPALLPTSSFYTLLNTAANSTYSDSAQPDDDVYANFKMNADLYSANPDNANADVVSNYKTAMRGSLVDMVADNQVDLFEAASISAKVHEDSQHPKASVNIGVDALAKTPEAAKKLHSTERVVGAIEAIRKRENDTVADKTYNFAMSVIPFRDNMVMNNLFNKFDFGLGGYEAFVNNYRAASEEDKNKMLDKLLAATDGIDGYTLEKSAFLSSLISDTSDEDVAVSRVINVIDMTLLGTDVAAIGKLGAKTLSARKAMAAFESPASVTNALNDAGHGALADKVAADAIKNPDIAKITGSDPDKTIHSIFHTDSVSQKMNGTTPNGVINNLVDGSQFRPETVNQFKREWVSQYENLNLLNPEIFSDAEKHKAALKAATQKQNELAEAMKFKAVEQPAISYRDAGDNSLEVTMEYKLESPDLEDSVIEVKKDTVPPQDSHPMFSSAIDVAKQGGVLSERKLSAELGVSRRAASSIMKQLESVGAVGKYESAVKGRKSLVTPDGKITETITQKTPKQVVGKQVFTTDLTATAWGKMDEIAEQDITFSRLWRSPKSLFESKAASNGNTVNNIVEGAGLVLENQSRVQDLLSQAHLAAIGKTSIARLNEFLISHEAKGRVLQPWELHQFHKATPDEIASYYKVNVAQDMVKDLYEDVGFKAAKLRGTQVVTFVDDIRLGRSYDTLNEARRALDEASISDIRHIVDHSTGKRVTNFDELDYYLKSQGKKIFVSDTDMKFDKIGTARAIIVPSDITKPITRQEYRLGNVDGYYPNIYQDAKYFVKESYVEKINGADVKRYRTYGRYSSKELAEKAALERKNEIIAKDLKDVEVQRVVYDREGVSPTSDAGHHSQGLATGSRASHEIFSDKFADVKMTPIQAIAKNIEAISRKYPINEWKMGQIERWKAEVRSSPVAQSSKADLSLHDPIDQGTSIGRVLEMERKYLASIVGIPDTETLLWEGFVRTLSEKVDKVAPSAGRWLRRLSTKDPVAGLKYLAFSTMLGWFNPAQLIVQATNMSIVAAMRPLATAKAMPKAMALRSIVMTESEAIQRTLSKMIGMNPDELIDLRLQFKRAGGLNIKTNADFEAAAMGLGAARSAFKKANETGLIFYRQGELSARTVAYTVAREEYMRANKIYDFRRLTDTDHRQIVVDYKNLMLNLGRENKAAFQRGILSLPTQFWQVQSKFIEMFLGKKFTTKEKMMLVLGQGALFGAAGLPAGTALTAAWSSLNVKEDGSYDSSVLSEDFLRQGMVSWLSSEVAVAGRAGIANALTDQLMAVFGDTQDPLWKTIMGASGTLLDRAGYAFNVTKAFSGYDSPIVEKDFWDVVSAWAGMASSFNNAEQAYLAYKFDAFIQKNTGAILLDSPTVPELIGKMLGFQITRSEAMYEVGMDLKKREELNKKLTDKFMQQMFAAGVNTHTYEFTEALKKEIQMYAQVFGGDNAYEQDQLVKSIYTRIMAAESKETRQFVDVLRNELSGELDPRTKSQANNSDVGVQK